MQKSTLIVGIILCVLIVLSQTKTQVKLHQTDRAHQTSQKSLTKTFETLNDSFKISELSFGLSIFLVFPLFYRFFKCKKQMIALFMCMLSSEIYFYLNISNSFILIYKEIISAFYINDLLTYYNLSNFVVNHGSSVFLGYGTFYLITLTFIALQQNHNKYTVLCFGIMCIFQVSMAADFIYAPYEEDKAILNQNYHFIFSVILISIISTMVRWTIIARLRANIKYGILAFRCRVGHYLGS